MSAASTAQAIASECLAMRARRMARGITRVYDAALRPLGLTLPQLSLLVAIERAGTLTAATVSRQLDLEKSTLSRNLRLLVAAGWVVESAAGGSKELSLTTAGREQLERALPLWEQAQLEARRRLGGPLVEALLAARG
jgi:DNA-binding MarR family transcriptional regulator